MWRCLGEMGLHGNSLRTLQQMYQGVQLQVRMGGKLSEPFPSTIGARQGCPMSPLPVRHSDRQAGGMAAEALP